MINVERISGDGLTFQIWRFSAFHAESWSNTFNLNLVFYGHSTRPTTRHKFKFTPSGSWDRSDQRGYRSGILAKDVPLPRDVSNEALKQVVIEVKGAS